MSRIADLNQLAACYGRKVWFVRRAMASSMVEDQDGSRIIFIPLSDGKIHEWQVGPFYGHLGRNETVVIRNRCFDATTSAVANVHWQDCNQLLDPARVVYPEFYLQDDAESIFPKSAVFSDEAGARLHLDAILSNPNQHDSHRDWSNTVFAYTQKLPQGFYSQTGRWAA